MRPIRLRAGTFVLVLALAWAAACSGEEELGPNASIAQLVGDWEADRLVMRNPANPSQAPDLISDVGATFTLNVQPSGQYTAILTYEGTDVTEIGLLDIDGDEIVFQISRPAPGEARSRFTLTGSRLTLDGETEFDFNFDRIPERAEAHIELTKR